MLAIEELLRQIVREEISRCVRREALVDPEVVPDDPALRERAHEMASRLRRARSS
jgi:hypothetical protein